MCAPGVQFWLHLRATRARELPQHVHDARANGCSWEQIARALATSPAEARLRFDPQSPVADGRWPYDF